MKVVSHPNQLPVDGSVLVAVIRPTYGLVYTGIGGPDYTLKACLAVFTGDEVEPIGVAISNEAHDDYVVEALPAGWNIVATSGLSPVSGL